jgi:hypothetical protein
VLGKKRGQIHENVFKRQEEIPRWSGGGGDAKDIAIPGTATTDG